MKIKWTDLVAFFLLVSVKRCDHKDTQKSFEFRLFMGYLTGSPITVACERK